MHNIVLYGLFVPNFDQLVGTNVSSYRQARGLSQADLAVAMTERGCSFHQQTIAKLEKGTRPLKLEEGVALADALDIDVDVLWFVDASSVDSTAVVIGATERLVNCLERLEAAAAAFSDAIADVRSTLATHEPYAALAVLEDARQQAELKPGEVARAAAGRRDAMRVASAQVSPELLAVPKRGDGGRGGKRPEEA